MYQYELLQRVSSNIFWWIIFRWILLEQFANPDITKIWRDIIYHITNLNFLHSNSRLNIRMHKMFHAKSGAPFKVLVVNLLISKILKKVLTCTICFFSICKYIFYLTCIELLNEEPNWSLVHWFRDFHMVTHFFFQFSIFILNWRTQTKISNHERKNNIKLLLHGRNKSLKK